MKKTDDIIALMKAGAHIELSGNKSVPDLIELASSAHKFKVSLKIIGSKKVEDLIQIVAAGRGRVTVRFGD